MNIVKKLVRVVVVLIILGYAAIWVASMTMLRPPTDKEAEKFFAEHSTKYTTYQVFNNQGGVINVYETGKKNGEPLLFIHGSPGNWSDYKEYMVDNRLTEKYRLIALDRPGFGGSTLFDKSLDTESRAILQVLSDMKVRSMTLVGHSYGGGVVARMASLEPAHVRHLIILSGMYNPGMEKPEKWRHLFQYFPLKQTLPLVLQRSNDELVSAKVELPELEKDYSKITSQISIMHGTDDGLVPMSDDSYAATVFSGAEGISFMPIEGKGHMIIWSDEDAIVKRILEQ